MFFKFKQTVFLALIFIFLFTACSGGATNIVQDTSEPANTEEPSAVQKSQSQTVEPVKEPTLVQPTPTPVVDQDSLLNKWRPPIGTYIFLVASCETVKETVNGYLDGEISDSAKFAGEVLGVQIIIGLTESILTEWEAPEDLQSLKEDAQDSIGAIQDLIAKWSDDELTTEELSNQLSPECETINEAFENITITAKEEGLSQDNLASILTDIQESFEEEEQASKEEAAQSITDEVGKSRKNPYPLGEVGAAPNWDIQILESIRGEEAWQMILAANQFNEPETEGTEYILIKVRAINITTADEERSISDWDFKLTGSHYILYSSPSIVEPDPILEAQLFPNGETEGWLAFAVGHDENNLILVLDELANWEEDRVRFYAVDEGASLSIPEEIMAIQPTDLGVKRAEPAAFGETVVTQEWEVSVLDVVRGEEAWQIIQEANQFNEPPGEGLEYALAKIHARYIGVSADAITIDKSSFKVTGSGNVLNDAASVVGQEPVLEMSLFPGGIAEGWVPLQVIKEETGLLLVFQPWADWDETNRRYLTLER